MVRETRALGGNAMAFVLTCYYRPGAAEARFAHRAEHLDYMIAALPRTIAGGALMGEAGDAIGMLVVLDAPDRAVAERFVADEPYNRAGLFERVELSALRLMSPEPEPGFLRRELLAERAKTGTQTVDASLASAAPVGESQ